MTEALKLGKHITPRAMRRTWHLTESMQEHYSTVALDEQREAMGKVIRMTRFDGGDRMGSGDRTGDRAVEMKKAG